MEPAMIEPTAYPLKSQLALALALLKLKPAGKEVKGMRGSS